MPVEFNVRPRHVQMFGAKGILAPLYQRQATKLALQEEERRSQSRFEQMKALTELRSRLEQPFQRARIGQAEAATELSQFQLGQAQSRETLQAETLRELKNPNLTDAEKGQVWQRYIIGMGYKPETQEQQRITTGEQLQQLVPKLDEYGKPTGEYEWSYGHKSPPSGYLSGVRGTQVSRLNLADRTLKTIRTRYNRDSNLRDRFDYSDIDWDSRPMKALGVERAGIRGVGKGVIGGGRINWMDNIMNTMATPATVIDSAGQVVPDKTEYSRRANIIENFRAELADEPQSSSKEKMRQLLHDMERAFNEAVELSSEEGQIFLSQPTQMMPQQRIVGEEVPYETWQGP